VPFLLTPCFFYSVVGYQAHKDDDADMARPRPLASTLPTPMAPPLSEAASPIASRMFSVSPSALYIVHRLLFPLLPPTSFVYVMAQVCGAKRQWRTRTIRIGTDSACYSVYLPHLRFCAARLTVSTLLRPCSCCCSF